MVDYDGQDAIITYLNGLAWGGLSEPTYQKHFDISNTEIPNVIIVRLDSITPERITESEYALHHHLTVQYVRDTKANAWPNLKYILVQLWQMSDNNSFYTISKEIAVNYSESRKVFGIAVDFKEILTM